MSHSVTKPEIEGTRKAVILNRLLGSINQGAAGAQK